MLTSLQCITLIPRRAFGIAAEQEEAEAYQWGKATSQVYEALHPSLDVEEHVYLPK